MKEFDDLCDIIEKEYGITREELTSKTRVRPIVELRGICSNIIYKDQLTNYGLKEIGDVFDVDHATILHYKKTFEQLYGSPSGRAYSEKFDLISGEYKKKKLTFYTLSDLLHKKMIIEETIKDEMNQKGEIDPNQKIGLDHGNLNIRTCKKDVSAGVIKEFLKIFNVQYKQNFVLSESSKGIKKVKKQKWIQKK